MKKILYLGIDLPSIYKEKEVIHFPIITISPRGVNHLEISSAYKEFPNYTHLIFTSKSAVRLFFDYASHYRIMRHQIEKKVIIAIGQATSEKIRSFGVEVHVIAKEETSEGVVAELSNLSLGQHSYLFWPHSRLSRSILDDFFAKNRLRHCSCVFYDSVVNHSDTLPSLTDIGEIVFTSPSTIDAFLTLFGTIPPHLSIHCIGPITRQYYHFVSSQT